MDKTDVILIGFEDQENLGLRSIKAYLNSKNVTACILPFKPGNEPEILMAVKKLEPAIIGFSFIFQYTISDFGKLIGYLRENGIKCHFTAGGHFPSLEPAITFEEIPELNSIVRFEGELTLYDLFLNIYNPDSWVNILGLAFKKDSKVVLNTPRPLLDDLDELPFLSRDDHAESFDGINMAYMLASRGCLFNCSFCSIRQFYRGAGGTLRRTRSASSVAEEMYLLYTEKKVRFFSFQDDDFAFRSQHQKDWLHAFVRELKNKGLSDKIKWKISCRVDDLTPESIEMMMECGLLAVYLGIESGNDLGLKTLNKGVTPAQNLHAIDLLKKYNLAASIGFMLFDPSSDMESIRQNIQFLKTIGEDGYFPVNFCKMLPYAGTPIQQELKNTGRLLGTRIRPDYKFADPNINWYYFIVNRIFTRRNFQPDGLVSVLQNMDFEWRLKESFCTNENNIVFLGELRKLIRKANISAVDTLLILLEMIPAKGIDNLLSEKKTLLDFIEKEWMEELNIESELMKLRKQYQYNLATR